MEQQQQGEAEGLVGQAIELAEAGDCEAAIPLFQWAVQLDPGNGAAHDMLAQCCAEAGRHTEAYAAAAAAAQLLPSSPGALLTLGRAARNVGRLKEAAAALEAALAAMPAGEEEAGEAARELAEVQTLRELEVGHAIGLPGLRLREALAGSQLGPGGAVWESGLLLARLLVGCSQPEGWPGLALHACTPACGSGCTQSGSTAATAAAAPLPGLPTFTRPTEAAPTGASTPAEAPGAPVPACHPPPTASVAGTSGGAAAADSGHATPAAPVATIQRGPGECSEGSSSSRSLLAGARVLELGSGIGAVGLAAACLGAQVLATDLPAVLRLLRSNLALNSGMVRAAGGSVAAVTLDWEAEGAVQQLRGIEPAEWAASMGSSTSGDPASSPAAGAAAGPDPACRWDWVLGADLVYTEAAVAPLVRTLAELVGSGSVASPARGSGRAGSVATDDAQAGAGQAGARDKQADRPAPPPQQAKLLLAHKHRHEAVDAALLEGLRREGVPLRAVARDPGSRVTVYGNGPAAAALGL